MIMLYWARVDSKPQRVTKLGIRDGNIVGVDEGFAIHTYGLRESPGPTIISFIHLRENRGEKSNRVHCLIRIPSSKPKFFIMRIIIVGAGVSGLSTYLLLEKLLPPILGKTTRKLEFLIYDSHISIPAGAGSGAGGIGNTSILPPTSIKILQQIDPELYTLFKSQGFENHAFTIRSARGHTLAKLPTTTTATTATDDQKEEYAISCPHAVLKECLREIVRRRGQPILQGKVVDVELRGGESPNGNQKPRVIFSDGRPAVEADLVIGADGVHSVVKRAVFGQEADEKHYAPEFE